MDKNTLDQIDYKQLYEDLKRREDDLRRQNELFLALMNNLQMGVFMVEAPSGKPLLANDAAYRLMGRGILPDVSKRNLSEVYKAHKSGSREPYPPEEMPVLRGMNGETTSVDDMVVERPDGTETHLEVFGSPVRDASGNIWASIATFSDITERKRSEEALRVSEAQFKAMVETMPLAIQLSVGIEQKTEYLNPKFVEMFGYTIEDIPSLKEWLPLAYPDDGCRRRNADEWNLRVKKALETRTQTEPMEVVCRCKDGSYKNISWGYITLGDKNYAYGLDLTDRKRAEADKLQLEGQLQQAMKMEAVGRLAGGVAHDFNNLLTGIIGHVSLDLLKLDPMDPLAASLTEVNKAAESAAELTRQLLAFSRKQIIEPRVLDLNEIISSLHNMLTRLIGENIELKTIPALDLGAVKVDQGQFEQILVNLAVNARDAMPEGGRLVIETSDIELDQEYCRKHSLVEPGSYVMLAVSDTGCGMGPEVKSHLFEPFYTTKPKGRGTGLGLATIYGTVKQAGGTIDVYSEVGKGTIFKIYLPRVSQKADRLRIERNKHATPGGTETVLLVEDDEFVREIAVLILEGYGYRVMQAQDGVGALQLAEGYKDKIHILLTDVVMPGMNGRQLAERLIGIHPETKVLYTSGYTENTIVHHGIIDHGINFIGKPYLPDALALKLRQVLDSAENGSIE